MARTMTEGREELIREVVLESVLRAESGGTLYAAPLLTELDAERAAHEATKAACVEAQAALAMQGFNDAGITIALEDEIAALKARLALADTTIEMLNGRADHGPECLLSRWEAGRPTPTGGYEWKYAGKWYADGTLPPCACGLTDALDKWRAGR